MGKCMNVLLFIVGAVGFMALGAVISGLSVFYSQDDCPSPATPKEEIHAECVLVPSPDGGDVAGTIFFHHMVESAFITIDGNITGLSKGLHGFHIHTYGVVGGDCAAAEGHYNPDGFVHGAPYAPQRHVGDLGNILSEDDGTAYINISDGIASLYGDRSVVGRSVVVHADKDDLGLGGDEGSLATGNAGARVACCTIFLAPHEA